jgi:NADPH:quinone reductase-like Zn-dependent oxidoreductase
MKAAWYENQGAARDVLIVGNMDDPQPRTGEVRIRLAFSGVNPGDVKKRQDSFGVGMPYPRVIPHSDGSGTVDAVGQGVSREWVGRRVWCYGAQSYRPFGTAAEYTLVPLKQVVQLKAGILAVDVRRRFGFHNLRHSLASYLVTQTKTDVKTVQSMLRHARYRHHSGYLHSRH